MLSFTDIRNFKAIPTAKITKPLVSLYFQEVTITLLINPFLRGKVQLDFNVPFDLPQNIRKPLGDQKKNIRKKRQKQPPRGVLRKRCSENMQQIYRRTPMPKCDFNKAALQLY